MGRDDDMQEVRADKLEEQAALLAHHWEEAGDALQALRCHARAGEWLFGRDFTGAYRHWRRVRDLARSLAKDREVLEKTVRACRVLLMTGWKVGLEKEDVDPLAAEAKGLAEELGDQMAMLEIERGHAIARLLTGDASGALDPALRAVKISEDLGETEKLLALSVLADLEWHQGRLEQAAKHCHEIWELGSDTPDVGIQSGGISIPYWALGRLGWIFSETGHPRDAETHLDRCSDLALHRGQLELASWALAGYALLEEYTGTPHEGLGRARRASELAEKLGSPGSQAIALTSMGIAHLSSGKLAHAVGLLERSAALSRERRVAVHWLPGALARLAEAYLGTGRSAEARRVAEEGVDTACRNGTMQYEARALLARARVLKELDGGAAGGEVEATLSRAESLVRETGGRALLPFIAEGRARLAQLLGDVSEVRTHLQQAHRLFVEMGATGHAERVAKELGR